MYYENVKKYFKTIVEYNLLKKTYNIFIGYF
jgi:hypothetical protein